MKPATARRSGGRGKNKAGEVFISSCYFRVSGGGGGGGGAPSLSVGTVVLQNLKYNSLRHGGCGLFIWNHPAGSRTAAASCGHCGVHWQVRFGMSDRDSTGTVPVTVLPVIIR
jgi:hypothetical protein